MIPHFRIRLLNSEIHWTFLFLLPPFTLLLSLYALSVILLGFGKKLKRLALKMHLLVCLFLKIVVYNDFSKSGSPKFTLHNFKLKYTDVDEMLKRKFILNALMIRKIHWNAEHALTLSSILMIYYESKEVKCHSPLPLSLLSLSVYLSFQFVHQFVFMIGFIFNLKCITPLPFKMHYAAF